MLIFVEGRDGSGKSTLCNKLYEKGFNIIKIAPHQNGTFLELAELEGLYICDRSFITDIVYRIFDGEPTGLSLGDMVQTLHKAKVRIVYCYTPNDYINSMERGEDNITEEDDADTIADIYENIIEMLHVTEGIPYISYNWMHDDVNKVTDFIQDK